MLTYFYYPTGNTDGFRILNISDDDNQNFYPETSFVNYTDLATDKLNIQAQIVNGGTEIWRNQYENNQILPFQYEISANSAYVGLNLNYDTFKKPLILGDDGYLLQAAANYTYYYSQTGVEVTGSINFNGITEAVTGTAWIDRQYGTMLPSGNNQYEWFSVQLSNGMDLNLWNIFENNQIPDDERYKILAAYVDENTQFTTADFQLQRLGFSYTSDHSRCYAQSWHLSSTMYNLDIIITADYVDSEVYFPFRFYEGSTHITGTVNGQNVTGTGFAELLHTYAEPEIQILNTYHWNNSVPLQWQVNNPDDGNPLTYSLAYSTNQITFTPVVSNLNNTQYVWNNPPLNNGDVFWLSVTAQSVDGTLSKTKINKFIYDSTAGINNLNNVNIEIYPNPAKQNIILKAQGIQSLEIIDSEGKTVKNIKTGLKNINSINVTGLKGVFLMKIYTNDGIFIRKIIITGE